MSNVSIKLRFYMPHDADLISLMVTHEIDIIHCLYCAATAFSNGDSFAVKIPPKRESGIEIKRIYCKNLILDTDKDQKLLELLRMIEDGYRNNFLKNILRLYLFFPATEAFLIDQNDMKVFSRLYQTFTSGKRIANAGGDESHRRSRKLTSYPKRNLPPDTVTIAEHQQGEKKTGNEVKSNTTDDVPKIQMISEDVPVTEDESLGSDSSILEGILSTTKSSKKSDKDQDELTDLFSALLG